MNIGNTSLCVMYASMCTTSMWIQICVSGYVYLCGCVPYVHRYVSTLKHHRYVELLSCKENVCMCVCVCMYMCVYVCV
jgi:hypothetical protein